MEHFYHFLLGFLVPLVVWYSRSNGKKRSRVYLRSCAILDPIILELGYRNIAILDREIHQKLSPGDEFEGLPLEFISIDGFDHPSRYSEGLFESAKRLIRRRLNIDFTRRLQLSLSRLFTKRVVIIDRRPSDPYYESERAEIRTSGADRRSIPNIDELKEALASWSPVLVSMEGLSLRDQFILFNSAGVIVAQHGAALANLLFCKSGAALIEVLPKDLGETVAQTDYFERLARAKKMRYDFIEQDCSHSPICVNGVLSVMTALMRP